MMCKPSPVNKLNNDVVDLIKDLVGSNHIFSGVVSKNLNFSSTHKETSIENAVKSVSVVKEAIFSGIPLNFKLFEICVSHGEPDVIEFLTELKCPSHPVGNLKIVNLKPDYLIIFAAKTGNIKNMEWLLLNGCTFTKYSLGEAILNGSTFFTLEWMIMNGCPFSDETFSVAVEIGNFDVMQWLLDNGCPFSEETFACASSMKISTTEQLVVMKWLKEKGCPWDCETLSASAFNGNLDNMIWLHENGCPFDNEDISESVDNSGDEDKKTWLQELGLWVSYEDRYSL